MEETMFVQSETLRVRSQIKAGLPRPNRCEELGSALRVRSQVKAGLPRQNRCDETGSLRVRTRLSAGRIR